MRKDVSQTRIDAAHGRPLYEHSKESKLEGLVAKRLGSP
jgi:ATP-dependent DNA ligase